MTFFGEIALSQNSITNCHYSVMFSPRAERNWKMLNWKIVLMKSLSNEYQANMLGEPTRFSNTLHSGACMQTCKIVIVWLILVVNHHFQEIPGSSFHFAITLKWITKWYIYQLYNELLTVKKLMIIVSLLQNFGFGFWVPEELVNLTKAGRQNSKKLRNQRQSLVI